jgi:hypothetical protein
VAVALDRLAPGTGVVYASYFAWYATHHDDTTWAERWVEENRAESRH